MIPMEKASSYMSESLWTNGTSEMRDACAINAIDFFAAKQQIFDQMLQFGQICMIIGFILGLTMPYLGRYVRIKYGWFTK